MDRSQSVIGDAGSVSVSELRHSGVKGMKWGVRRSDPPGDSRSNPGPPVPRASEDAVSAMRANLKANIGGLHTLSNQELQQAISRMNLENQYRNLTTAPARQSELDRGLQTAQKALKVGATIENARKFMATPTGKAVKTGLTGAFAAAAAYATGGASAAATAGASVVIRRAANHYTNTGN